MRNAQIEMFPADTVSSVAINSDWIDANQVVSASFIGIFEDLDADGTLKVQGSNYPATARYTDTETPDGWADIPNATSAISNGVGPAILIGNCCFSYLRVVWTPSGGDSGAMQVYANILSC